jgi:putative membrane protein
MSSLLIYIRPWEFSPAVLIGCIGAITLYILGMRQRRLNGEKNGHWRALSFFTGILLIYIVMQTYVDYLSQHMFWVHRFQHLVLHHLAPLFIILAYPLATLGAAIPQRWHQRYLLPFWQSLPVRSVYRFVQHPVIAPLLFFGLIYFWLQPEMHFDAMLSSSLFQLMNWSMLVDGLLFWFLILDDRMPHPSRTLHYPIRILILFIVMLAQIILGSHIAMSKTILYDVYSVCGRAWPIEPITDQMLGGLTTWIPAGMMSVLGIMLVIRLWMRNSEAQIQLDAAAIQDN